MRYPRHSEIMRGVNVVPLIGLGCSDCLRTQNSFINNPYVNQKEFNQVYEVLMLVLLIDIVKVSTAMLAE